METERGSGRNFGGPAQPGQTNVDLPRRSTRENLNQIVTDSEMVVGTTILQGGRSVTKCGQAASVFAYAYCK